MINGKAFMLLTIQKLENFPFKFPARTILLIEDLIKKFKSSEDTNVGTWKYRNLYGKMKVTENSVGKFYHGKSDLTPGNKLAMQKWGQVNSYLPTLRLRKILLYWLFDVGKLWSVTDSLRCSFVKNLQLLKYQDLVNKSGNLFFRRTLIHGNDCYGNSEQRFERIRDSDQLVYTS
ncbi:hypothetical protein RhiirA4_496828 [Rhizophagus irregularis]|uniref:Uncharacterized protein n=1 Tax=Rhizophagus irregularis TaxID=588596 RepID=A0A2I1H0T9_9GLOM|nr:hypothetical protein RhiirA4_496828 [Rhizophagus irregularis]